MCALQAAATKGVKQRFLLQEDADRIVAEAAASNILQSDPNNSIAKRLCKKPDRDDDHRAIDAHQHQRVVSVEGELARDGRMFRLINPRMFSVS